MLGHYAIDEIPAAGVIIEDEPSSEWVDLVLGNTLKAGATPASLRIELMRRDSNVLLDGDFGISFSFECSRCAEEASSRLSISLQCTFARDTEEEEEGHIETWGLERQCEIVLYKGDAIDIQTAVTELVVFALPAYPVCCDECRGICVKCGRNLNDGSCACTADEVDPRWVKLKDLKLGG